MVGARWEGVLMRAKYLGDDDRRQPEEISDVIASVIEGATVSVDLRHGELVERWGEVVPGDWALGTPVGVRDTTLLVAVPDGATGSLLTYQSKVLIEAIDRVFGTGLVTAVRLKVDRTLSPRNPSG